MYLPYHLYSYRVSQLFFPFTEIGKPCFRCFISESFFHRSKSRMILEIFISRSGNRIKEVSFILFFRFHITWRNASAQSYGFFSVLHGVVYGPVRSPATYQAFVVGVRYRAFDVYYTGSVDFVFQLFFIEGFYKHIAVSAVECVAVRHA